MKRLCLCYLLDNLSRLRNGVSSAARYDLNSFFFGLEQDIV